MEKRMEALVLIDFARYKKDLYKTKKKLESFADFLFSVHDEHMQFSAVNYLGETIAREYFPEELKDDLHAIVKNAIEGINKEINQADILTISLCVKDTRWKKSKNLISQKNIWNNSISKIGRILKAKHFIVPH